MLSDGPYLGHMTTERTATGVSPKGDFQEALSMAIGHAMMDSTTGSDVPFHWRLDKVYGGLEGQTGKQTLTVEIAYKVG